MKPYNSVWGNEEAKELRIATYDTKTDRACDVANRREHVAK